VKIKSARWGTHALKDWIEAAKKRLHHNVLVIVLANKLARIAWWAHKIISAREPFLPPRISLSQGFKLGRHTCRIQNRQLKLRAI
jgi:hypothetical protein